MNKLYLFGCSHSEITSGLAEEDFWGDLLAKKLNLQFSPGMEKVKLEQLVVMLMRFFLI